MTDTHTPSMVRNVDLLRQLLIELESQPPLGFKRTKFDNFHPDSVGYHVYLLADEGYITATPSLTNSNFSYYPILITAKGQEFLAAIRQDTAWNRLKSALGDKIKTLPTSVIASVATTLASETVKQLFK